MHITSEHTRAARARLRWEQSDLARACPCRRRSGRRAGPGPPSAHAQTVEAVDIALEPAGVEFTNGDAPGVKLVRRKKEPAQ
jgi:hypothetical protein